MGMAESIGSSHGEITKFDVAAVGWRRWLYRYPHYRRLIRRFKKETSEFSVTGLSNVMDFSYLAIFGFSCSKILFTLIHFNINVQTDEQTNENQTFRKKEQSKQQQPQQQQQQQQQQHQHQRQLQATNKQLMQNKCKETNTK